MVASNGIYENNDVSEKDFLAIAFRYGNPIKSRLGGGIIDTLISKASDQKQRDSLTKRYGTDKFPIHTDGAYLKIPPKVILLKYVGEISKVTPTIIVHFDFDKLTDEEIDFVKQRVWFVKGENMGFYSKIYQDNLLRYDREVMKLVNSEKDIMDKVLQKMKQTIIEWEKNKVVAIDNYSVLHFRPKVLKTEENKRIIQRINVL